MQTENKFDQLAIVTGQRANELFSNIIYCSRFIRSADDIASDEIRTHFIQMLRAANVRIDSMLQILDT